MTEAITKFLSSVPSEFWTVLGATLAISGIQAAFVGFVEKRIDDRLSDKTNQAINGALAALAEGLNAITSAGTTNPQAFGSDTLVIVGASQFVYRYVTLPLMRLLKDAKAHRANQVVPSAAPAGETASLPLSV